MPSLKGISTRIFGNLVERYSQFFYFVKTSLPMAEIRTPLRTYMSLVFLFSTISLAASLVGINVFIQFLYPQTPMLLRVVYSVFGPILIASGVFILLVFYPHQKFATRRKSIETNLPFVLTHMGAIAQSGVPPYVIFRLISQFEEYGEISAEMKKIVRNIDTFGIDPLTAVKETAERTPSGEFKQVLMGFVTTTESGGDIKFYLKASGEQALFDWRIRRERFLQQLSAYAEFYTGILIAAPLFLIALFAVMNMIQPTIAGYDILFLTKLSIYLVIPLVNITFLLFLRGVEVEL